jgi:hypothetical protein
MSTDIIVSLVVLSLFALILHLKSHVKFMALGLFVGLVLSQTAASYLLEFLQPKAEFLSGEVAQSLFNLLILLIPTVILGINHVPDKRRMNILKVVVFVLIMTLFFVSTLVWLLPVAWQEPIVSNSQIVTYLLKYRLALLVAAAILIIIDSFDVRKLGGGKKKGKI